MIKRLLSFFNTYILALLLLPIGTVIIPMSSIAQTTQELPTVAFTTVSTDVSEGEGTVALSIELLEANSSAVEVEVVFLAASSTATNGEDFNNISGTKLRFSDTDVSGTTKTVSISITDDNIFERSEKAVFGLQDITSGSILAPDIFTLTIHDNDAPDVVINEILYEPNGDANGDGFVESSGDEFIELVNNSTEDINISNWTLSDGANGGPPKFSFPDGSVVPAGRAFVVFGDSAEGTGFGGALLFSSGSLALNDNGGDLILKDASSVTIDSVTYEGAQIDASITRYPDLTGDFMPHTEAGNTDGSAYSPGTRTGGTAFGSPNTYAIGMRGGEGWRMIASPRSNTTLNNLMENFRTQGITGSDDPTGMVSQYYWDETGGGGFRPPDNMNLSLGAGKGYIVYIFEEDGPHRAGVQGGLPKTIRIDAPVNSSPVSISVSATDHNASTIIDGSEGWNLLSNPFATDISVDGVLAALEAVNPNLNANVQIWHHNAGGGNGDYVDLSSGDTIAPFQAFWIRYTATGISGNARFNRSNLAAKAGSGFYKRERANGHEITLSLHGDRYNDPFTVAFNDYGTMELDKYDSYKLFSLNSNSINLYGIEGNEKLSKNVLPDRLQEITEIPLSFEASGRDELSFRWQGLASIPSHWDVMLVDRLLDREVDLRRTDKYSFINQQGVQNKSFDQEELLYKNTPPEIGEVRFVLRINPGLVLNAETGPLPSSNQLNPNYPNPFNPTTTISYSLTRETEVKISVWNIVGQKVATLVDGTVEAGTHTELWNANDMPSGIYIAQMEVGGNVYIRKMTLIK